MWALTAARGLYWRTLCKALAWRPFLSPRVVEGGQLSHHPLAEEGWAGRGSWRAFTERTLCINEANLSVNQIGGGTPGQEVLLPRPIKMSLNPPLL